MDVELNRDAKQIAGDWLSGLNAALQANDARRLGALFRPDCDWRDIVALTWTIETVSDRDPVARRLLEAVAATQDLHPRPSRGPARPGERWHAALPRARAA